MWRECPNISLERRDLIPVLRFRKPVKSVVLRSKSLLVDNFVLVHRMLVNEARLQPLRERGGFTRFFQRIDTRIATPPLEEGKSLSEGRGRGRSQDRDDTAPKVFV